MEGCDETIEERKLERNSVSSCLLSGVVARKNCCCENIASNAATWYLLLNISQGSRSRHGIIFVWRSLLQLVLLALKASEKIASKNLQESRVCECFIETLAVAKRGRGGHCQSLHRCHGQRRNNKDGKKIIILGFKISDGKHEEWKRRE